MTPQSTLEDGRELSERAMLRPAPTRLRLARPEDLRPVVKPKPVAFEELHPIQIGGSNRPHQAGPRRERPRREHVTRAAMEKDWFQNAVDKAEAQVERRPVVIPAGQ